MKTGSVAAEWAVLVRHFAYHARLLDHFEQAGPAAVVRMWRSQTNAAGKCLTQFERDALIERHCELFGTWPD